MKEITVTITLCTREGDPDDFYVTTLLVPYNATEREIWDAARKDAGTYFYKVEGYPEIVSL